MQWLYWARSLGRECGPLPAPGRHQRLQRPALPLSAHHRCHCSGRCCTCECWPSISCGCRTLRTAVSRKLSLAGVEGCTTSSGAATDPTAASPSSSTSSCPHPSGLPRTCMLLEHGACHDAAAAGAAEAPLCIQLALCQRVRGGCATGAGALDEHVPFVVPAQQPACSEGRS